MIYYTEKDGDKTRYRLDMNEAEFLLLYAALALTSYKSMIDLLEKAEPSIDEEVLSKVKSLGSDELWHDFVCLRDFG